jgi:glutathione peroxidase
MKVRLAATVASLISVLWGGGDARADKLDWSTLDLPSLEGGHLDATTFVGRPVLVVNTASLCGFTPQYEGLQALWERYRDQGLVVFGVPSDDFGGQEYDSDGEIKTFCEVNYGIDFPMLESQNVKGADAHPLFAWIARQAGPVGAPRWNFYKYLIAPDGSFVDWFASTTKPQSAGVIAAIETVLPAPSP